MISTDFREKAVNFVDKAAFLFFAILIFFLPISNAVIESCFGFIYLCFILRCIFRLFQYRYPSGYRPDPKNINRFFKERINLSLLVFYILIGLSMFVSGPLLKKSFNAWFFKWGEGFLLFYFAQVFIKKQHIKLLILVFLSSSFLISLDGIYQKVVGHDFIRNFELFQPNSQAPRATFGHYNDFATYLAVVVFILFGFLSRVKKILPRLALFFLFLLIFVNLFFTYSRGAWLSLAIASMSLMIFFTDRKAKIIIFCFLLIFILSILSSPFALKHLSYTFSKGGDANRFNIWKVAFLMFKDSSLLGQGVGTFMDRINAPQYFERMSGVMFQHGQYAHNCFLQILAESGILGFLSFVWFLTELLLRAYRRIVKGRDLLLVGIFCALLVFLVHSFFDTQFYSLKLAMLFWVLASFLAIYIKADF